MLRFLLTPARAVWRQPLRALGVLTLLGLIGIGGGAAGLRYWVEYQEAAACHALTERDYDLARNHILAGLRFRPRSSSLNLLLARVARQGGRYPETERALDAARQYGASPESLALERGLLRAQQGQLTLELELALRKQVNESHAETIAILEVLSQAYMQSYRLKDARDCLDVWLKEKADDFPALMSRGWVHERLDQFEKARDDYRRAAEVASDRPEAELRLGQILLLIGSNKEAYEVLERVGKRLPGDPVAGLALAQAHARLARHEEAEKLLDALLADHPREASLLLERGNLALQQGDASAAEPWLRKAAVLLPMDYQTNYTLWQCLRQRGKEEEAKEVHAKVKRIQEDLERMRGLTDQLQSRPHDANLRCEIAKLFLSSGEKREALLWFQAALQLEPHNRAAHEGLAKYYEENGDPAKAARHRATSPATPGGQ